jgi:hypothetical protein
VSRGIDAIGVAQDALAAVRAEAEQVLPDPEQRDVVAARYVERLLISDLGVHLSLALGRSDPLMGALFAAIEAFLATVPRELLAQSDALATHVVEPPLARWGSVPEGARSAYWSLYAAALAADPGLARRAGNRLAGLALGLGPERAGFRRSAAIAMLRVARFLGLGILAARRVASGLRRRLPRARRI